MTKTKMIPLVDLLNAADTKMRAGRGDTLTDAETRALLTRAQAKQAERRGKDYRRWLKNTGDVRRWMEMNGPRTVENLWSVMFGPSWGTRDEGTYVPGYGEVRGGRYAADRENVERDLHERMKASMTEEQMHADIRRYIASITPRPGDEAGIPTHLELPPLPVWAQRAKYDLIREFYWFAIAEGRMTRREADAEAARVDHNLGRKDRKRSESASRRQTPDPALAHLTATQRGAVESLRKRLIQSQSCTAEYLRRWEQDGRDPFSKHKGAYENSFHYIRAAEARLRGSLKKLGVTERLTPRAGEVLPEGL